MLIELFGIDGKLITVQTRTIPGGKSQIEFSRETLQQRSVVIYRITGEGWSASGKLIRQ
ncbi:MAG: hypothetical protein JNJ57_14730 [Saprospiraceae bacterium]|nr:hypothetical protein [Saprospiraceae bacterium]